MIPGCPNGETHLTEAGGQGFVLEGSGGRPLSSGFRIGYLEPEHIGLKRRTRGTETS